MFHLLTSAGGLRTMATPTKCTMYNNIHINLTYINHGKNVPNDPIKDTSSLPKQ
jgi:hypothetical protein